MNEKLKIYDEKMQKTIHALDTELASIRAGRANPNILNKLTVEYYGTPTPIQQVANISVPEARMIQIQPWEKKIIKDIEKAILMSDIGINPTNDGTVIRLVFPELTEERRKELVKDVKKKGEASKVAVRNIRRDGNDAFKKLKGTDVSEDEIQDLEDQIQKLTDKYIKEVDAAVDATHTTSNATSNATTHTTAITPLQTPSINNSHRLSRLRKAALRSLLSQRVAPLPLPR